VLHSSGTGAKIKKNPANSGFFLLHDQAAGNLIFMAISSSIAVGSPVCSEVGEVTEPLASGILLFSDAC
jgi:hypothetical protein